MRSCFAWLVVAGVVAAASAAHADITITQDGVWALSGHVAVTACALGRCKSARSSDQDSVFLPAGSTVQIVVQVWDCGSVALDDYCTLVPGRGDRMRLRKCDKTSLGALLRECSPYPSLRLRRIGGFERVADDGQSFQWKSTFGFGVRVQGYPVAVSVAVRVDGQRTGGALEIGAATPVTRRVSVPAALVETAIDAALSE